MMRALLLVAVLGCSESRSRDVPEVRVWGALREMIHEGRIEGRVDISTVVAAKTYAVGALAGMRGEITIVDGVAWVARGAHADGIASRTATDETAALLVVSRVVNWHTAVIRTDISFAELDARVERFAIDAGLTTDRPFAFVIEGDVAARWHVLRGPPPPGSNPHDHTRDAIVGNFSGHATVVGFFSKHHEGVFTHIGQRVHAHVVVPADNIAGHADELTIRAGATIRVPQ